MHSKTRPKPRDLLVWPSELGIRWSVCQTTWSGILTLMRNLVTSGIAKPIKVHYDLVIDWPSVFFEFSHLPLCLNTHSILCNSLEPILAFLYFFPVFPWFTLLFSFACFFDKPNGWDNWVLSLLRFASWRYYGKGCSWAVWGVGWALLPWSWIVLSILDCLSGLSVWMVSTLIKPGRTGKPMKKEAYCLASVILHVHI